MNTFDVTERKHKMKSLLTNLAVLPLLILTVVLAIPITVVTTVLLWPLKYIVSGFTRSAHTTHKEILINEILDLRRKASNAEAQRDYYRLYLRGIDLNPYDEEAIDRLIYDTREVILKHRLSAENNTQYL